LVLDYFFENVLGIFTFLSNQTRITGTFYEAQYTFFIVSHSLRLRMRNITEKAVEISNAHFMLNNFVFRKSYRLAQYKFFIVSHSLRLRMRNITQKVVEISNAHFMLNNFCFPKIVPFSSI